MPAKKKTVAPSEASAPSPLAPSPAPLAVGDTVIHPFEPAVTCQVTDLTGDLVAVKFTRAGHELHGTFHRTALRRSDKGPA